MSRLIITFITCFVLDNLLVIFLPIQPVIGQYVMIPNVFLICLALFTFYDKGKCPMIFAIIFGLLYDICYADVLGLYICLFPIITFILIRFISPLMPVNILAMIALVLGLVIFEEGSVYFIVNTMVTTNMSTMIFVKFILIPTAIFNMLLTIPLY
ncbi:MAG: rod shape-determining protein MreD, partial [Turicibacter sp.]|nr:rod shape-determining protein MreD [Turicibacter sp.]